MSLSMAPIGPVPEETARVAHAAFPRGTRWMRLRDELGVISHDSLFQPLFASRGRPAEAPWRLALVSVLQFAEDLSDRQAADAVRGRLDWKYLLGLELVGAVGQPVQRAVAQDGIVPQPQPLVHRPIRGEEEARAAVALDDEVVEIGAVLGAELA